jgi:ferritin-like metal-binding protein YciE
MSLAGEGLVSPGIIKAEGMPMTEVETAPALLVMALKDLLDGEAALFERLGGVADASSDAELERLITEDRPRSGSQRDHLAAVLEKLGEPPEGSENVWLRAILDDADNDASTIARGPLRDIALTGALRKAKQAERVSYETALALAERLDLAEAVQTLRRHRNEEQAADEALAGLLTKLVVALGPQDESA